MAAPDDGDGEWRFSLEDLDGDDDSESGGNVAGTLTPDEAVTPGEIDPENAFFVLVGVLLAGLFVGAVIAAL